MDELPRCIKQHIIEFIHESHYVKITRVSKQWRDIVKKIVDERCKYTKKDLYKKNYMFSVMKIYDEFNPRYIMRYGDIHSIIMFGMKLVNYWLLLEAVIYINFEIFNYYHCNDCLSATSERKGDINLLVKYIHKSPYASNLQKAKFLKNMTAEHHSDLSLESLVRCSNFPDGSEFVRKIINDRETKLSEKISKCMK